MEAIVQFIQNERLVSCLVHCFSFIFITSLFLFAYFNPLFIDSLLLYICICIIIVVIIGLKSLCCIYSGLMEVICPPNLNGSG